MEIAADWRRCDYLIVVVNYRTPLETIECLNSLSKEIQSIDKCRVVIVDNCSGDDSVSKISQAILLCGWEQWATVISSNRNGGFSYGNNFAIRQALSSPYPPKFVHLLNPDTEVRPEALVKLYDFMVGHPTAGICGGSFENEDGSDWNRAFRFPTIFSEINRGLRLGLVTRALHNYLVTMDMDDQITQVDWVSGASFLVRSEVFKDVGLFDENYFLYYEETDFCLNANRAGWECWYVPTSKVMHISGKSTGIANLKTALKRMPKYIFDSRIYYFGKNHGEVYAAIADLAWICCLALWRVRRAIQRKPDDDPPKLLIDSIRNGWLFSKIKKLTQSRSSSISNS